MPGVLGPLCLRLLIDEVQVGGGLLLRLPACSTSHHTLSNQSSHPSLTEPRFA